MDRDPPTTDEQDPTMADRLTKLEATVAVLEPAVRQLQAEREWIRVALQGRTPNTAPEHTRPPLLGPILVAIIGAAGVIIAARLSTAGTILPWPF